MYPWPSNFYTTPTADSPTGLAVALPAALLPKNTQQAEFPADEFLNGKPGFTPNAQLRFASAQPVDGSSLPPLGDIGSSLAEQAPIVLLEVRSGERWPYFAEVDATAVAGEPQTIFVRPMRRPRAGERYVVAVRGLRDKNGEEIPASPLFRALRDELTTDVPQLEAERARYDEIFAALARRWCNEWPHVADPSPPRSAARSLACGGISAEAVSLATRTCPLRNVGQAMLYRTWPLGHVRQGVA
ncbi:hypothetical protein [Nannocystis pusilla]|uniref:hypothetical protein n=1 Tax=Nannocystis pusilla TaxID=889268 RepID=UPI003BF1E926